MPNLLLAHRCELIGTFLLSCNNSQEWLTKQNVTVLRGTCLNLGMFTLHLT